MKARVDTARMMALGPTLPVSSAIKNTRHPSDPGTHEHAWLHPMVEHSVLPSPDGSFLSKPLLANPFFAYKR
jgi:hypothetical protein